MQIDQALEILSDEHRYLLTQYYLNNITLRDIVERGHCSNATASRKSTVTCRTLRLEENFLNKTIYWLTKTSKKLQ